MWRHFACSLGARFVLAKQLSSPLLHFARQFHASRLVTEIKQAVAAAAAGGRSGKILIVPRG
jgi:hypothetical protein